MRRCFVVILFVFVLSSSAFAYKNITVNGQKVYWPTNRIPVPLYIHQDGSADINDGSDIEAVKRGYFNWNNVSCSYFEVQYVGTTTMKQATSDGYNLTYWIESGWPAEYGPQAIGVTTPKYGYDAKIYDADMELNGENYIWTSDATSYCNYYNNMMDVENIVTHEAGHFLGLDHSSYPDATMAPSAAPCETSKRSLSQDDINGVCDLYPASSGAFGTPCSSNSDCDSGICLSYSSYSFCSKTCSQDSDCGSDYSCQSVNGTNYCVPKQCPSGGAQEGQECSSSCPCANSLLCITTSQNSSSGQCRRSCNPNSPNCGSGYTCLPLNNGGGACFPATQDEGDPCSATQYCKEGLICITYGNETTCRYKCNPNIGDCPRDDLICYQIYGGGTDEGACYPYSGGGCTSDSDCSSGQVCVNHTCKAPPECATDQDCPSGEKCMGGQCKSTSSGCTSNSDCPNGQICVNGQCKTESNNGNKKGMGESCSSNNDCASGLCDGPPGKEICTNTCSLSSPCPSDYWCVSTGIIADDICWPRDREIGELGSSCTNASDCFSGACINVDGRSYCSDFCDASNDQCPDGYSCSQVQGTGWVCVRDTQEGSRVGEGCYSDSECLGSSCLEVASKNVCVSTCSDTQRCPAGFICSSIENHYGCYSPGTGIDVNKKAQNGGGCCSGNISSIDFLAGVLGLFLLLMAKNKRKTAFIKD